MVAPSIKSAWTILKNIESQNLDVSTFKMCVKVRIFLRPKPPTFKPRKKKQILASYFSAPIIIHSYILLSFNKTT